jgi:hypothetical protein
MANPIASHLRKIGVVPTVREWIALAYGLGGHYRTVRDLERAGLCEDLGMLAGLVATGELIDAHGEFPDESAEFLEDLWQED